ncbi:MAG: hypothetical protein ACP5NP_13980, partial [Acetobacteraceae bacterium]
MFLLLDMLSAIGGAAVVFSLVLGLGAALGRRAARPVAGAAAVAADGFAGRLAAALERAGPAAARA